MVYEPEEELVLQSRYGLLHYANLICRTGLVIFLYHSVSLSNLATPLITYGAPCITFHCSTYTATFVTYMTPSLYLY